MKKLNWTVGSLPTMLILFVVVGALNASALGDIQILPNDISLFGPQARQTVIVETLAESTFVGQLRGDLQLSSSDTSVFRIDEHEIVPVGNGKATLTAKHDGQQTSVEVEVQAMDRKSEWEFTRHVLPVLSKSGCNTGACHGALAGKGGFKLSLRGYNPAGDHFSMTRAARGRRIELSDPGRSLVLAKPTGALRHKGGVRLEVGSYNYQVLSTWIQDGAKTPTEKDAKLSSISVFPDACNLKPGDRQQILVRASYDDGRQEDVTRWANFSSTNEAVIKVDKDGVVEVIGHGEGAVVAWFSSQIVLSRVTSPFANEIPHEVFANADEHNFIDRLTHKKLQQLRLAPSKKSSDSEFLRRVYLDSIGTLPTREEAVAFLNDNSFDKRNRLIDDLLGRVDFVDYWTHKWSDLLLINGRRLRPKSVKAYYDWLRAHVQTNTAWDKLVREIVTAKGSSHDNGATNFYALHQDPENMTENVCQAFLGLSIACAKCHNHPLEKWTNDQYYGLASHFARVKAKGWGGDGRSGDGLRTVFVADQGELIQPLTGRPQPPTPLDGESLSFDASGDRREHLAKWLTAPENPYFSRSIANRIWAGFFGRGLVESVDDMRLSNPASNEELLDALSDFVVEHDFDLKQLMRTILRSATYQRSSLALPENKDDDRFFSRYYPRRLSAEVLLDAVAQVTEVPSKFTQIGYKGADFENTTVYPIGTRAIQLHDSAVVSSFLKTFGRNERDITCECERSNTPSMVQVLHLSNGTTINDRLRDKDSCVAKSLADADHEKILDHAYLSSLSRLPTDAEKRGLLAVLRGAKEGERQEILEDLYWSIMSSREFLFNH